MLRVVKYAETDDSLLLPYFEVNLLNRPMRTKIIDTLQINSVSVNLFDREMLLDFSSSQGVNIGFIETQGDLLQFRLEYFSSTVPTFFVTLKCSIDASTDKLSEPVCQRVDDEL